MNLSVKNILSVILLLMLMASASLVNAMPRFPAPPRSTVSWVAEDVVLNTMPMSVRKFKSGDGVEAVRGFYRRLWKTPVGEGLPGFIEQDFQDWKMISRFDKGFIMVVQAMPDLGGGSWGYLGISQLDKIKDKVVLGKNVPKMNGSKVISDIKHNDTFRKANTVTLQNKFSVSSNASFYKNHYLGRGWDVAMNGPAANDTTRAMVFKKGRDEVSLTIIKTDKGSQIVMNVVN
ncbi:MAG: hypothetical protein BMS9Abin26_1492 [Gammaproteobacteria bacterium]|nr:MAG: hypothetical protein BMS9Abin26_1492 [Gammaproteobacteria bacterium]